MCIFCDVIMSVIFRPSAHVHCSVAPHVLSVNTSLSPLMIYLNPCSIKILYRTGDEMVISTSHSWLHEFDMENETVTAYLERVELYFDVNILDEKMYLSEFYMPHSSVGSVNIP